VQHLVDFLEAAALHDGLTGGIIQHSGLEHGCQGFQQLVWFVVFTKFVVGIQLPIFLALGIAAHAHGDGPRCSPQKRTNFQDILLSIPEIQEEVEK